MSNVSSTASRSRENYLEGQLLVATPNIVGSSFRHSVVLVCAHGKDGTMGIIFNHPLPNVEHSDLFRQFKLPLAEINEKALVYYGGPVEVNRGFVIYRHEDRYKEDAMLIIGDIAVSGSIKLLTLIAENRGPKDYILALGYAGWGAGQLESEMQENCWISVPLKSHLVFDTEDAQKWQQAAASCGVDFAKLSTAAGHA